MQKNFLIPTGKALSFTKNNYKVFESKKADFEKESADKVVAANAVKEKIIGKNVIIIENASDDGRLYGSVNAALIAEKINAFSGSDLLSRNDISLEKPIKEVGVYKVLVSPHSDVTFTVRVVVSRSESEVDLLLKAEKGGVKKTASKSDAIFESMKERFAKAEAEDEKESQDKEESQEEAKEDAPQTSESTEEKEA